MLNDWRDVRFDTGAKFGSDRAIDMRTYDMRSTGSYFNYQPGDMLFNPPFLPDPLANPDPTGKPGDLVNDPVTDTLQRIDENGDPQPIGPDGLDNIADGEYLLVGLAGAVGIINVDALPLADPGGGLAWLSAT